MRKIQYLSSAALLALVACGGAKASSGLGGGKGVPPPPPPPSGGGTGEGGTQEQRTFSEGEKSDYKAAMTAFMQNDTKGGWNESACRSAADRFQSVVRSHPKLVEAQFMVGLSYHRCNLAGDAEKAYQLYLTVLRPSMNNGNGTSANWFDMYSQGSYTIFQIDANLGGPTAALEMVLYSRPGLVPHDGGRHRRTDLLRRHPAATPQHQPAGDHAGDAIVRGIPGRAKLLTRTFIHSQTARLKSNVIAGLRQRYQKNSSRNEFSLRLEPTTQSTRLAIYF